MTKQPNSDEKRRADQAAATKPSASDPYTSQPANAPGPATSGETTEPEQLDEIDEAIDESFPASDPPSYTGGSASPSVPKPK